MKLNTNINRILTLTLILLFVLPVTVVLAQDNISVTIDGQPVQFTGQQPVIINGRILVPVRGVFEALGFDVSWNPDTWQTTLTRDNDVIVTTANSAAFTVNGRNHTLYVVPPQIINGSMMLPIRAVHHMEFLVRLGTGQSAVIISTALDTSTTGDLRSYRLGYFMLHFSNDIIVEEFRNSTTIEIPIGTTMTITPDFVHEATGPLWRTYLVAR